MALTEKAKEILEFLEEKQYFEEFTTASLKELMDKKISAATLTSMVKKGYLERFDTTPKTYQFLKEKSNEVSITSKKKDKKSIVSDLFELANTIESEVESIFHWMESDSYATEPGTQIGIYKITEKETNRILYIGKTERPFQERWKEHKELLKEGNHHSPELQKYFDKIDRDLLKIKFEILQELPSDPKIIDLRERYWIDKYSNEILNYMKPKLKK